MTSEIKKEIVAFANTGGGTIYIGIEDDGTICGLDDPQKVQEQISSMAHDAIKPYVTMFISCKTKDIDSKQIVEVAIHRGTARPYYLTDKRLKPSGVICIGNTSIPATETSIRNMIIETNGTKFEEARSLNQNLTFDYAIKEFQSKNIEFEEVQKRTPIMQYVKL